MSYKPQAAGSGGTSDRITPDNNGNIYVDTDIDAAQHYISGHKFEYSRGALDDGLPSTHENSADGSQLIGNSFQVPANFWQQFRCLRVTAQGLISTDGASGPSFQCRIRLFDGSTTITLTDSGSSLLATGLTNRMILVVANIYSPDATPDATQNFEAQGYMHIHTTATALKPYEMINTATVGTVDATTPTNVRLVTTWTGGGGTPTSNNTVTFRSLVYEWFGYA